MKQMGNSNMEKELQGSIPFTRDFSWGGAEICLKMFAAGLFIYASLKVALKRIQMP